MLDVHPPHQKIHGFWDFSLHLFTITVGLLIALSLESCVGWQHHRHLVRDAEAAIHGEIVDNAQSLPFIRQQMKDQGKLLDQDLAALAVMRRQPKSHQRMSVNFRFVDLNDLAWKTAQTTGATEYMPYSNAQQFSEIYTTQEGFLRVQQQVVDDTLAAAAPVIGLGDNDQLGPRRIDEITDRIGLLKMRMVLLDSYVVALDGLYKKYETSHPNK